MRARVPGSRGVVADGEADVVKLAVRFGDHGGDGAEGVTAGGVFVGAEVAGVGQVTGAHAAGGVVVVVVVVVVNGASVRWRCCSLAGHEAEDGVGDLLLVELGLAGLVEVAGGLAKLLVGEIVEGLVDGDVAGAQSVAVEGAGDAGAKVAFWWMSASKASQAGWWRAVMISASHLRAGGN